MPRLHARSRLLELGVLHSVSALQQLVSQFYGSFNNGACARFLFFVRRSFARQVAENTEQCNRASTPNRGNLQRYIFNFARQVVEKVAQCNRALKVDGRYK